MLVNINNQVWLKASLKTDTNINLNQARNAICLFVVFLTIKTQIRVLPTYSIASMTAQLSIALIYVIITKRRNVLNCNIYINIIYYFVITRAFPFTHTFC